MNEDYRENTTPERMVIDYIAGMTDDYFQDEYKQAIK
jgi:dGTP triphosphohydrolase